VRESERAVGPRGGSEPAPPLLDISGLRVCYTSDRGVVRAVDGVDLQIRPHQVVGLVGESGCGKSATALSLMGLLPRAVGEVTDGKIMFDGVDLVGQGEKRLRRLRGREIAMIFQDPMTSLNPAYTVGDQLAEPLREHLGMGRREASARSLELLADVGIPNPARVADGYPHQLSGGMRQRVMIAIAMACGPRLLIADEATTALDVTIQAQILELLAGLQERTGMAMLFISHDLGVVARTCDRVAVMYAGRVVEDAPTHELFRAPSHPYTRGLLGAIPRLGAGAQRLTPIRGQVPPPGSELSGCRFAGRCELARARCHAQEPELLRLAAEHSSRCWLAEDRRGQA
jgi:oligopeptide/dipeptide ABC transporter ATP-binding protein